MPTARDAPGRVATLALPDLDPDDAHGPRGVGELGIGAVAPAIANAVADALGSWPAACPLPPDAILDAVRALEGP
jgi:nicotinate dehydrogenase large molybdopterin subunit